MAPVPPIRPTYRAALRRDLLAWWDANARTLPWRAAPGEPADPYRVWLSEIMLQQTTVAHASPYFERFVARWPTVEILAEASDSEVMAAWAGLGYYARARNLLACARVVARDMGGVFPAGEAQLRRLPGLGAYTAAAIAAIAFGGPANVVDANIERVIGRLYAIATPPPAAKGEIRRRAGALATTGRPGDWAQALMDLGATICRPTRPLCEACPWRAPCRARRSGSPQDYPRRAAKADRPHRHGVAFLGWRGGDVAMVRRPAKGLLGGMLGFPTTPWRQERWSTTEVRAAMPGFARPWRKAGVVAHGFTHFSLDLEIWIAPARAETDGVVWLAFDDAMAAAPSLFRNALRLAAADAGRARERSAAQQRAPDPER